MKPTTSSKLGKFVLFLFPNIIHRMVILSDIRYKYFRNKYYIQTFSKSTHWESFSKHKMARHAIRYNKLKYCFMDELKE